MSETTVEILDLKDKWQRALFDEFVRLYLRSFRDLNEQEDPKEWVQRLTGNIVGPSQPKFHLVVSGSDLIEGCDPQIHGGTAFEYYGRSSAGLLTYIVVDEAHRGKGTARRLISSMCAILKNDAHEANRALSAIFAESHDPSKPPRVKDVIAPDDRMRILSRLGAKWVNVDYVQPSLGEGKDRVRTLLLLCFPCATGGGGTIRSSVVKHFMEEFYEALGVRDAHADADLCRTTDSLTDGFMLLRELPTAERPVLHFTRAAMCIHAVARSANVRKTRGADVRVDDARSKFRSFELDLLSYRYQCSPPFISRCVSERPQDVVIHYPESSEYETEGRRVPLFCPEAGRRRKARAILSKTIFSESGMSIWHLTLQPRAGDCFTEYDLIKLTKLYGGVQESNNLSGAIQFSIEEAPGAYSFHELLAKLSGDDVDKQPCLRGGTIELDVDGGEASSNMSMLVHKVRASCAGDQKAMSELESVFRLDCEDGRVLKALCGVITGIFDFGRMSVSEMLDTFEPTVLRGTSMIRIHRGTLISIDHNDDMLDTSWDTIGVSPYLIVPQAVMLQNDAVVDLAEEQMDTVMGQVGGPASRARRGDSRKWDAIRQAAERHLRLEYLPNVFQYATERQILDEGGRQRGSIERTEYARERLRELATRIDSMRAIREERSETIAAILLAFLSGTSLHSVLFALVDDFGDPKMPYSHVMAWVSFAAAFSGFFCYFCWIKWSAYRR